MRLRIRVLPAAERDLDDQADYINGKAGEATVLRFYEAAAASYERIARMPGLGATWAPSWLPDAGLRLWQVEGFEKHLIIYREDGETLEVVRVLHAARDLEAAFESD